MQDGVMNGFIDANRYTLIFAFVILLCVVYYVFDPLQHGWIPRCPVKMLTSLSCPGCGFQRALHSVMHGHFKDAISYNLFLLVAIPIACFCGVVSFAIDHIKDRCRKKSLIHLNVILAYTYIIFYFCWFVVRNVIGM